VRILVIGGTLFIGRRLVRRLLQDGHEVTVLHRKPGSSVPADVAEVFADRNDSASVARAAGPGWDCVCDLAYDWTHGTTGHQVLGTLRALEPVGRYVFMSSVAAYLPGLDRDEDAPLCPSDHPDEYARNKADAERLLLDSGADVVTVRPPFVYGPENPFLRETWFWNRWRDGRVVVLPDGGVRLMHFVFVDDLVNACQLVMTHPDAARQAFNVAHEHPATQEHFVELLGELTGEPYQVASLPRDFLLEQGGHVHAGNLYFGQYLDLEPITVQTRKMRRLGWRPSSLSNGLRQTYQWYLGQPRAPWEFAWLDELLMSLR
jgi:nucleoside-diphosphate-sugar epimerase